VGPVSAQAIQASRGVTGSELMKWTSSWGTKEWFDDKVKHATDGSDEWGNQWRGSQQLRYTSCLSMIQHILSANQKLNILDIGCGLGDLTARLCQDNPQHAAFGVDITEKAVLSGARHYPCVSFSIGALPDLAFRDDKFDLVLCLEVIYYLKDEDRVKAINGIKRVLKEDGYVLLSSTLTRDERYLDEDVVVSELKDDFDIEGIYYEYGNYYEIPLCRLIRRMDKASQLLTMDSVRSDRVSLTREHDETIHTLLRLRELKFMKRIMINLIDVVSPIIRLVLKAQLPTILMSSMVKWLSPDSGKQRITILGKKINGCRGV
jgi:2-polyprenyl-3-methyl-5-hydroxy-6-metoxy-1,4-benzoquinol methylase